MARIPRSRRLSTRHIRPYPTIPSYRLKFTKSTTPRQSLSIATKKSKSKRCDWEDATCSVCMECPHNAVLLLCSSHEKGCRPYMCATSFRHSNCLDQFKKAYTKSREPGSPRTGSTDLTCPLCRGQVKGWTIVEPAREFLNSKQRTCMQDGCGFIGTYKELRKHVKGDHPSVKPREVDPAVEQKWRSLEHERERQDVISTIRSSMPRAVVFGDYVIEMDESDDEDEDRDDEDDDRDDDVARGDSNRSILYFFLREGARFMRYRRGGNGDGNEFGEDGEDGEEEDGIDGGAEEDGNGGEGREDGLGFGMERRRRRRRRSRVRFV